MDKNKRDYIIDYGLLSQNRSISIPCLAFCVICALILGLLPALSSSLTQLFRPIYLIICVVFLKKNRYPISKASISLIILFIYLAFILLINEITKTALSQYVAMLLFALFFIFTESQFWTKWEIKLVLNVVIVSCSVYAILMLFENESLRHLQTETYLFLFGNKINRNTVAFTIVPGTVCSMFCLVFGASKKNIWRNILYIFTTIICLYTVFATGGRSAFYSAAFGDFLIVWEVLGKKTSFANRIGLRILVVLGTAVALIVLINLTEGKSIAHVFNLKDSSGRDEIWEVAWRMIRDKPVLGGGFDYWSTNSYDPDVGTHNNFLTIMLESGWIGGILFGVFILFMLIELCSCRNYVLIAFALVVLFHTWTEVGMDYYAYIPLCLSYMLYHYLKNVNQDFRTLFNKFGE